MGAVDRSVQHLHLRAPSAQAAVRAVHRLEDALRCASLPDTGERLLLVRRLHLGRLPEGLSSQSLSLLIEQRVAAVGGEWVLGDDEHAARSDTVFFASRLQAAQVALHRRAQGGQLPGWFWSLALPGVDVQAAPAVFLHQLVDCLGAGPSAPITVPALVAHAVSRGAADWLVRYADAAVVERLLMITVAQRHVRTALEQSVAVLPREGTVWLDAQGRQQVLSAAPGASAWLVAVLRAASWRPQASVPPDVARRVTEGIPVMARVGGVCPVADEMPRSVPDNAANGRVPWPPAAALGGAVDNNGAPVVPHKPRAMQINRSSSSPVSADPPGTCAAWLPTGLDHTIATRAGGLLFLLPVLERLGFAAWQADHMHAPLCPVILRQTLQHLRLPEHDPAWALVASLPAPAPAPDPACVWTTPQAWRGVCPGARLDPAKPTAPDAIARLWLMAVRRYLRREGGFGLHSLCLRPARLGWTDTHLDVHFALTDADLRVRRLALDLDPGWLPWLGRVVAFVYEDARP